MVPLITGITLVMVMEYLINPVFGALNQLMVEFFTSAGDTGRGFYSAMIAAGTAFDLGGPVNKAAGSVALGLNGVSETFDLTARELAIVIPSIGVGIAAFLNGRFGLPAVLCFGIDGNHSHLKRVFMQSLPDLYPIFIHAVRSSKPAPG